MPTKAKATTKAKPATKSKARSSSRKAPESQYPEAFVANARFAPGTEVGIWKATDVGSERAAGRAPFPKPLNTAKVAKDGSLKITGLPEGTYVAAARTGDDGSWTYLQFPVKSDG